MQLEKVQLLQTKNFTIMLNPGEIVKGRYKVERTIGGGAFGTVYLVSDSTLSGTKWALKEMVAMELPAGERRDALLLFSREAEILRSLHHPGLPEIIDFFSVDDSHYLVMEYIDGSTLEDMMKGRESPFSSGEVLPWALQVCAILKYLHGITPDPVIFRDLKPSNIMVGVDGKIRLIDFGIARYFSPKKIKDTIFLGTPGFSPPEQYGKGQSDPRSDVFALGATLYYLLSKADMERYATRFPPLSTIASEVPEWLEKVIMKCLSVNPGERYQSAAALFEDISSRRFSGTEGESDQGNAPSQGSQATHAGQIKKTAWIAAGIILAVVITLVYPLSGCLWVLLGLAYLLIRATCFEKVVITAAALVLAAIVVPNFIRAPNQGVLTACKSNLKNIGTALEMYNTDNGGLYPKALSEVTPNYLKTIPTCAAAGKVTYEYITSEKSDAYTTFCSGHYHKKSRVEANYPQYDSIHGLIENSRQ
ncbi:MAG: protein kinase [Candidatus Xenobiia bacterium LiM19]